MGLFSRKKNVNESIMEEQLCCDGCGKSFNKTELRKCHYCGAILCHHCRAHHICPSNISDNSEVTKKYIDKARKAMNSGYYDKVITYLDKVADYGNEDAQCFLAFLNGSGCLEMCNKGESTNSQVYRYRFDIGTPETFGECTKRLFDDENMERYCSLRYKVSSTLLENKSGKWIEGLAKKGNADAKVHLSCMICHNRFDLKDEESTKLILSLLSEAAEMNNEAASWLIYYYYNFNPVSRMTDMIEDTAINAMTNIAIRFLQIHKDNIPIYYCCYEGFDYTYYRNQENSMLRTPLFDAYHLLWELGSYYYHKGDMIRAGYWLTEALDVERDFQKDPEFSQYLRFSKENVRIGRVTDSDIGESQYFLAKAYLEGDTVPKSPEKAAYYYQISAEMGHAKSQFALAQCYFTGSGVPKNESKVRYWINKSIQNDDKDALEFILEHPEFKDDALGNVTNQYYTSGDYIQGDVGILAKDDAIVNRASLSLAEDAGNDFKFCIYCGKKLPMDAIFCMACGKKL